MFKKFKADGIYKIIRRNIVENYKDKLKGTQGMKDHKEVQENLENLKTMKNVDDSSHKGIMNQDYTPRESAEGRSYGLSSNYDEDGPTFKGQRKHTDKLKYEDTYQDVRGRGTDSTPGGFGSNQSENLTNSGKMNSSNVASEDTPKPKHPGNDHLVKK